MAAATPIPLTLTASRNVLTCVCCPQKGSVVVVNQRFEQQEDGIGEFLKSLFCCCKKETSEQHKVTREAIEQNVILTFASHLEAGGDLSLAQRQAKEMLEKIDPDWDGKTQRGEPVAPEIFEAIKTEKQTSSARKAHTLATTIRSKSTTRPALAQTFPKLFQTDASSEPSDVASLLPELMQNINQLQASGVNGIDQVTQVQRWLAQKGYPFSSDFTGALIELLENKQPRGPHFSQLVSSAEDLFTLAASASVRD